MSVQPSEPDDLMALAEAVGVTVTPSTSVAAAGQIVPLHAGIDLSDLLSDAALIGVVSEWALLEADAPVPFEVAVCPLCQDTRAWTTTDTSPITGEPLTAACPACAPNGESR